MYHGSCSHYVLAVEGRHDRVLYYHAPLSSQRGQRLQEGSSVPLPGIPGARYAAGRDTLHSIVEGWSAVDALYFSATTLITVGLVHLQDRFRVTGYSNAHENSDLRTSVIRRGARKPPKGSALQRHFHHAPIADAPRQFQRRARPEDRLEPRMRLANGARRHPRLQREGPSRPPSEVLAPEEDPRRFRPEERRGVAGDAPPLSERVRIPEEPVDSCDGLRGGLRRGTHRRAHLGETVRATLSRLLVVRWMRAKRWITSPDPFYERKKASFASDRLMEVAGADPEWAVGFLDECWWSRVALPTLNAWAEEGKPPRLIQRSVAKDDPEPKAISCYGLYLPALDRTWIRFVDGRPVSSITTRFLEWSVRKLEAVGGKKVLVLIWDNASWHVSKEVRSWLGSHNRRVKESGEGVRIVGCLLPKQSPWLNAIEPKWIHGKRKVVEADGLLGAYELADRVCKVFDCPHHEHLTVPQKVA